jgi:hypothetical protein
MLTSSFTVVLLAFLAQRLDRVIPHDAKQLAIARREFELDELVARVRLHPPFIDVLIGDIVAARPLRRK